MNNLNDKARFDRRDNLAADGVLPLASGVLPEDFAQRLERIKEASGLSWRGLAEALGVDPTQMHMWRKKGVESCGGADARRPGDPLGRGLSVDLLQRGELDARPRRMHFTTAARRGLRPQGDPWRSPLPSAPARPARTPVTRGQRPDDSTLRLNIMKDATRRNGHDREDRMGEDAPEVAYTPEQRRLLRKGLRIWASVAIRSYMRKHEAASPTEDAGEQVDRWTPHQYMTVLSLGGGVHSSVRARSTACRTVPPLRLCEGRTLISLTVCDNLYHTTSNCPTVLRVYPVGQKEKNGLISRWSYSRTFGVANQTSGVQGQPL